MVYVVTQIIKHSGFNLKFSHFLQQLFTTGKQTINKHATGKNNSIQGCAWVIHQNFTLKYSIKEPSAI